MTASVAVIRELLLQLTEIVVPLVDLAAGNLSSCEQPDSLS
jgi:hypothetical protein